MDKKIWVKRDEVFWALILGVLEGVAVYEITEFSGTCNLLNLKIIPCWQWGLIVWTVSMIATYYIGIKGSFWLFPKLSEAVKHLYRKYKNGRNARLLMFSVQVENKYYISVHNEEFLYRLDSITVNSKFKNMEGENVDKNAKWFGDNSNSVAASITRKKSKLLHIATVSDGKLIIHLIGGDEVFPFPNTIIPYYVIPLVISGSVSFLNRKIKKIRVSVSESVYIYNDGKSEMRWQKEIRTR
jgi:hypothetical protein